MAALVKIGTRQKCAKCFDPTHKKQQLEEHLPKDLQKAYSEGVKMAKSILKKYIYKEVLCKQEN